MSMVTCFKLFITQFAKLRDHFCSKASSCYGSINIFLPSISMWPKYFRLGCYEKFSLPRLCLAQRCSGALVFNFRTVQNYSFTSHLSSQAINPCSKRVCDPNANCIYLGPNQHKCTCREGYAGDGQICLPTDPCQAAHGSCPAQSSICIYDGPGKVSATAQEEIMLSLQKEAMRIWKQLSRKPNTIPSFTISPTGDQEGILLAPLRIQEWKQCCFF